MNRARLSLFFPKNIAFILLLNWIHSFILQLIVASSGLWYMQGGYIGHKYAIFAGFLGKKVKSLAVYYLFFFFFYSEGVLGLTSLLHLGWSSCTLLQYWGGSLISRHKLLSQSSSANQAEQSELSRSWYMPIYIIAS